MSNETTDLTVIASPLWLRVYAANADGAEVKVAKLPTAKGLAEASDTDRDTWVNEDHRGAIHSLAGALLEGSTVPREGSAELTARQRIQAVVRRIPAGYVMSYGDVAVAAGISDNPREGARAVGSSLMDLDFDSDVPWWRVVKNGGSLFGATQSAELRYAAMHVVRLVHEGVTFQPDGRVDMSVSRWTGQQA